MTSDRWGQVEELFSAAADLPLAERGRFLDRACRGDAALREEVETLLNADDKNGEGILNVIEREAQALFHLEGVIGSRLGAYRIVDEIGRGGMGTVYLAVRDDDQFQKRVAIKLIRRGMDTQDILDRFRHERQILANLNHPHIATLLDGGTAPDGRPFLVMEYVPGETLDVCCRKQDLDLRARCRLFLKVCEAVSYAHRNLVVHRDLKPGNILVMADGSPKLLDFGIARLVEADAASGRTAIAARRVTPDYAGPEEVRGERITTAADVYSLGAILYELVSGQRVHQFPSYHPTQVEHIICEVEPPRPSDVAQRWSKQIRGDLDAIIAKALRKEPALRYASVEQLSADLERYLNGWSVQARQGNLAYRTRKFLRRNRTPIAAGVLFAAVLIGGATVATLQARRATREAVRAAASQKEAEREAREAERQRGLADEQRKVADDQRRVADEQRRVAEVERAATETERLVAERRFEQVRQLAGKFLLDFHDSIAKLPGSIPARKMVVETGLRYYDTLVQEAQGNRDLLEEIARGYDRLGDVQGNPYYANVGDTKGALASYRKAQAIRDKVSDPSESFLRDRIAGNTKIAQMLSFGGDMRGADQALAANLQLGRQGPAANTYPVREALANAYSAYGDVKIRAGDFGETVEPYTKMLEIWTDLAREKRNPPSERSGLSISHTKLGDAYTRLDKNAEALEHLRLALEIDQQLAAEDANNVPRLRKVFIDYMLLGVVFRKITGEKLGAPGEARSVMEKAVEIADKMVAVEPSNTTAIIDVFTANSGLGDWLREHDEVDNSLIHYRKALEAAEKAYAAQPPNLGTYDALVQAHHRIAVGFVEAGQLDNALDHFGKADEYNTAAEKLSPGLTRVPIRRAEIASGRGDAHRRASNWKAAIAAYNESIATYIDLRKRDPQNQTYLNELPKLFVELADCYAAGKQWSEARAAAQNALDRLDEIQTVRALEADEQDTRKESAQKLAAWKEN